jgi:hypothetical protein
VLLPVGGDEFGEAGEPLVSEEHGPRVAADAGDLPREESGPRCPEVDHRGHVVTTEHQVGRGQVAVHHLFGQPRQVGDDRGGTVQQRPPLPDGVQHPRLERVRTTVVAAVLLDHPVEPGPAAPYVDHPRAGAQGGTGRRVGGEVAVEPPQHGPDGLPAGPGEAALGRLGVADVLPQGHPHAPLRHQRALAGAVDGRYRYAARARELGQLDRRAFTSEVQGVAVAVDLGEPSATVPVGDPVVGGRRARPDPDRLGRLHTVGVLEGLAQEGVRTA